MVVQLGLQWVFSLVLALVLCVTLYVFPLVVHAEITIRQALASALVVRATRPYLTVINLFMVLALLMLSIAVPLLFGVFFFRFFAV